MALHKIHRFMRRKAINMSEHTVQCNCCQHTVIKMQHEAKIVQSIFHDYNWFYGQYLDSLNVVLLLYLLHCKDFIASGYDSVTQNRKFKTPDIKAHNWMPPAQLHSHSHKLQLLILSLRWF